MKMEKARQERPFERLPGSIVGPGSWSITLPAMYKVDCRWVGLDVRGPME